MTAEARLRLFFGVPVEEPLRAALCGAIAPVEERPSPVRWTKPDQLHVTVLFLGDVAVGRVDELSGAAGDCAARFPPGPLSFEGFGSFRRADGAILWAGAKGEWIEALARAAWEACRAIAPEADEPRRPFRPHVTIGRARWRNGRRRETEDVLAALETMTPPAAVQEATRLVLYRSELTPQGPVHTETGSWSPPG